MESSGTSSPPVNVPAYLLEDPWTEDDELLLEFEFQNEVTFEVEQRKWERGYWTQMGTAAIIPYTWEHTNLHQRTPGDALNLEFDVMGKYVARLLDAQLSARGVGGA